MGRKRRSAPQKRSSLSSHAWSVSILQQEKGKVECKRGAPVRIALAYPNTYEVGMASLGFQTVYRLFNEHPEVRCERVFIRRGELQSVPLTVETGSRVNDFDMMGFSLSFELDIPNLIRMIIASGMSPLREKRHEKDPILLLGGVVAGLNPSPLLPFMDGLLAGEGEGVTDRICDVLFESREKGLRKSETLHELGRLEGVFIPGINRTVRRHVVPSLEPYPVYTPIVSPSSHFGDLFVVETGRGCPRTCLFCAARKVYHPYRFRSLETLLETVRKFNPGSGRIGLEGAGLSDLPCLEDLSRELNRMGYGISFSSLRADRLNESLAEILVRSGVRSFTMAPEAGSEELRKGIGKRIDERVLLDAAEMIPGAVSMLKLYFLIGLPGETDRDVEALIDLVRRMGECFRKGSGRRVVKISVSAFIPKPFTEFQWAPMAEAGELERKKTLIRKGLKREKAISLVFQSTREEILQGLLSIGTPETGIALLESAESGISMKKNLEKRGIEVDSIHRERDCASPLPWDFIASETPATELYRRYRRSVRR